MLTGVSTRMNATRPKIDRMRVRHLAVKMARNPGAAVTRLPRKTLSFFTRIRMRRMTDEERFTFDLEGYLILKNVLTADEVAELSALARQRCADESNAPYVRIFSASRWGARYQALIDHPRVVPILDELLGPKFRLDHDYVLRMTRGGRDQDLHGGELAENPDHWYAYRDGRARCGLSVVQYCLTPVRAGDGGFCCIPGSHKSNFHGSLPLDVREFKRIPHYVRQPEVEAGDVILFTEALVHGTMPWTAERDRLAVLYKYCPGHSAWMRPYYDANDYPSLTRQQARILAPPSVGGRPDSIGGHE